MRYWKGRQTDDGNVHCMGNGRLAVYEQGPDIIQLFGPPYSSNSYIKLNIIENGDIEAESERKAGTAIWSHKIYKGKRMIGEITDFVDADTACMARKLGLAEQVDFLLVYDEKINVLDNKERFKDYEISAGLLSFAEAGMFIYNRYPNPHRAYHQFIATGNLSCVENNSHNQFKISCGPGESFIFIIGGPSYPECIENSESILKTSYEMLFDRTLAFWKYFTGRRYNFENIIPENFSKRDSLISAIDDVSVLIKAQQGKEGGVLAGHNYHLGYIRDQYGVSRALLKLGYLDEAKAVLRFYWNIWKKYGILHNAQAIGLDGIFHIHENDEVEITGYLVIQAFDYYSASGDDSFLEEIFPMLEWAWNVQKKNLVNNMLPFNGDETYIAGGILPRSCINDGSAEATLLFITGGEKLIEWACKRGLWTKNRIDEEACVLKNTIDSYRSNFWESGKLYANNPDRTLFFNAPKFRHGVCEICYDNMVWTERNRHGYYTCPKCWNSTKRKDSAKERYYLKSVSLTPIYIGATLFSNDEISALTNDIVNQYEQTGKLPSRPDGSITVGYDYGLFLYTLAALKHPLAVNVYEHMMSVVDSTGAWVEYYENNKPMGTRCRPWESGINLEAAIYYALGIK